MFLHSHDEELLIDMLKYHSIFPKEITDKFICGVNARQSPNPSYRDSNHISIEYHRMQTFVKIRNLHKFKTLGEIRHTIQKEFNHRAKSIISVHTPTIEKYPEFVI